MTPGFGFLMMLACAVFYYRLGEAEYSSGWLLAVVSLTLWLASGLLLGPDWLGGLLTQGVLFAGLSVWNVFRSPVGK